MIHLIGSNLDSDDGGSSDGEGDVSHLGLEVMDGINGDMGGSSLEDDWDLNAEELEVIEAEVEEGEEVVEDEAELLQHAMLRFPLTDLEVPFDLRPCDVSEDGKVKDFMDRGCDDKCKKWKGGQCSKQFSMEHVKESRMYFADLTHDELDLVVMGQLIAASDCSAAVSTESRHAPTERKRTYTNNYYHQGKAICPRMFRFIHGIGEKRFKNIKKALKKDGLRPRIHGNKKRTPKHTLSLESVQYIVQFLLRKMHSSCLAVFLGTAAVTSSFFLQALASTASGRCTFRQPSWLRQSTQ